MQESPAPPWLWLSACVVSGCGGLAPARWQLSQTPVCPAPVPAAAQPPAGVPALTVADDGRLVALPPQARTAAPQVVSVTPDTTATVATTNGSR